MKISKIALDCLAKGALVYFVFCSCDTLKQTNHSMEADNVCKSIINKEVYFKLRILTDNWKDCLNNVPPSERIESAPRDCSGYTSLINVSKQEMERILYENFNAKLFNHCYKLYEKKLEKKNINHGFQNIEDFKTFVTKVCLKFFEICDKNEDIVFLSMVQWVPLFLYYYTVQTIDPLFWEQNKFDAFVTGMLNYNMLINTFPCEKKTNAEEQVNFYTLSSGSGICTVMHSIVPNLMKEFLRHNPTYSYFIINYESIHTNIGSSDTKKKKEEEKIFKYLLETICNPTYPIEGIFDSSFIHSLTEKFEKKYNFKNNNSITFPVVHFPPNHLEYVRSPKRQKWAEKDPVNLFMGTKKDLMEILDKVWLKESNVIFNHCLEDQRSKYEKSHGSITHEQLQNFFKKVSSEFFDRYNNSEAIVYFSYMHMQLILIYLSAIKYIGEEHWEMKKFDACMKGMHNYNIFFNRVHHQYLSRIKDENYNFSSDSYRKWFHEKMMMGLVTHMHDINPRFMLALVAHTPTYMYLTYNGNIIHSKGERNTDIYKFIKETICNPDYDVEKIYSGEFIKKFKEIFASGQDLDCSPTVQENIIASEKKVIDAYYKMTPKSNPTT